MVRTLPNAEASGRSVRGGGGLGGGRGRRGGGSRRGLLGSGVLAGALFAADTGGLALQRAEIVEAGAANTALGHHLDLLDARRVQGENALYTHAVGDLADGERRPRAAAVLADHHTLENLNALFVAFFDQRVNANAVSGSQVGQIGAPVAAFDFPQNWVLAHGKVVYLNGPRPGVKCNGAERRSASAVAALPQQTFLLVREGLRGQQIRAARARQTGRFGTSPALDGTVVARKQHGRDRLAAPSGRPRPLWVLEPPRRERLVAGGQSAPQYPGHEPPSGLQNHRCRQLPASEHEIPDAQLLVHERRDPLVYAFVAPANEGHAIVGSEPTRGCLIEQAAARGEEDHGERDRGPLRWLRARRRWARPASPSRVRRRRACRLPDGTAPARNRGDWCSGRRESRR